uniref:Ribosomal protein S3 n=1 Tax=Tetrahymena rostrata TaxID=5909 RepID=A0A650DE16_TETRO|nr:ribosomal protein S3 [Tetrahymena rostrata]QGS65252.1 ribosomal protein S3 [Tetrahymena rostrata]
MGLKSLPLLNKSGISMYWTNVWDSIKLYKKYSLSFLFLNDVIYHYLNENLYYYCLIKIRKIGDEYRGNRGYKHINISKIKKSYNLRHYYLGKILFLKYQNWVIVLINFFTVKRFKYHYKNKILSTHKKLFKCLRKNPYKYAFKIENYKYKF